MKKILSLVLVIVMVFSLMTVASAKDPTAAFTDGKDVKNVAAVDLLTGLGIIDGANGAFDPAGTLTREQAAKIIAYLLNGTAATNLKAITAPFTDVAATRWSAGYIAFCVEEGILNGVGDNKFNPEGKLTGFAWAKMLLCALGYDAAAEEFTGGTWTINVAKTVNKTGLALGLNLDFGASISRDDACQLAYNTLTADLVEYSNSGTTITIGDTTVATAKGEAQKITNTLTSSYLSNPAATETIAQFCEMYFPDLELKTDATQFGRSGNVWRYASTSLPITGFNSTDKVLATNYMGIATVTKMLNPSDAFYKALPNGIAVNFYLNGTLINQLDGPDAGIDTYAENLAYADTQVGNGVTVQLLDNAPYDGDVDTVIIIDKAVAKLGTNPVTTTTSGAITYVNVAGCTGISNIDKTYVHGSDGLAKDDVVKYYKLHDTITNKDHWYIEKCTSVTGTVTGYNSTTYNVTINGTGYGASQLNDVTFVTNNALFGIPDVIFYLDDGGYICYTATTAPAFNAANYVFIKNVADTGAPLTHRADATATFMDGTSSIITISKFAESATATLLTPNWLGTPIDTTPDGSVVAQTIEAYSFYSFTKNEDGTYNIRYAANQLSNFNTGFQTNRNADFATDIVPDPDVVYIPTTGNANTIFVYENTTLASFYKYTGVANAPKYTLPATGANDEQQGLYVLENSTGSYALAVVGLGGVADNTLTGNFEQVYITGAKTEIYATPNNYYTYPALVNGEVKTIESTLDYLEDGELYLVNAYLSGKISGVIRLADGSAWTDLATNKTNVTNFSWSYGTMSIDGTSSLTADTCKVFVYDTRVIPATVTAYTPEQINGLDALVNGNDKINYIKTSGTNGAIAYVYVEIVGEAVPVIGVSLNPTTLSLIPTGTAALTATVAPIGATTQNVTWTSSNATAATVVNGVVTAHAVGTAIITVKTVDGNYTATCLVTVSAPVAALSVDIAATLALNTGANGTLTATVLPANATNKTVSWLSSDTAVATVVNGVVTAVSAGTATITVTTADGGWTDTCTVTVTNVAVTSVTLSQGTLSLSVAGTATATLTATVNPGNATNKTVSWLSSDTAVATVVNGVVTAVAPGTATITVTTADGGQTATCTVTVTA